MYQILHNFLQSIKSQIQEPHARLIVIHVFSGVSSEAKKSLLKKKYEKMVSL